jgi:hypothetical protein
MQLPMPVQPIKFDPVRTPRSTAFPASLILMLSMMTAAPAEARGGGHSFHHGSGDHEMHEGGSFAGGRHHGNDAYVKAASDEEDKLLKSKIKSICRGC